MNESKLPQFELDRLYNNVISSDEFDGDKLDSNFFDQLIQAIQYKIKNNETVNDEQLTKILLPLTIALNQGKDKERLNYIAIANKKIPRVDLQRPKMGKRQVSIEESSEEEYSEEESSEEEYSEEESSEEEYSYTISSKKQGKGKGMDISEDYS